MAFSGYEVSSRAVHNFCANCLAVGRGKIVGIPEFDELITPARKKLPIGK
jgi:hypothetical protein